MHMYTLYTNMYIGLMGQAKDLFIYLFILKLPAVYLPRSCVREGVSYLFRLLQIYIKKNRTY